MGIIKNSKMQEIIKLNLKISKKNITCFIPMQIKIFEYSCHINNKKKKNKKVN